MENLKKIFDVIKHCDSYRINTYLESNTFGYSLTLYLHDDHLRATLSILSILKVLDLKSEIEIKDTHYENGDKMRMISIKTERA